MEEKTEIINTDEFNENSKSIENNADTKKKKLRDAFFSAGGVILGGGAVAAAYGFTDPRDVSSDPVSPTSGPTPNPNVHPISPIAESVTDDMSFGEAFASARKEVGSGGIFEWHGNVYNTYTAEEWAHLTPEQQHEFAQSYLAAINDHPEAFVADNDDVVPAEPIQHEDHTPIKEEDIVAPDTVGVDDPHIEVIGHEQLESGEMAIAISLDDDSTTPEAVLLDNDNDGFIDSAIVLDDSGEPVSIDVSDQHIMVAQLIDSEDNNYSSPSLESEQHDINSLVSFDDSELPDYMNDADVDFA